MCVREDNCRRQVGRRHASSRRRVSVRRHVTKPGRARTRVAVKTRGRAETFPEDRPGEATRPHEDTWAGEDSSRRLLPKTGLAKTHVVAKTLGRAKTPLKDRSVKTHGHAKTLPEDTSGEDTLRREDMRRRKDIWACEDTSRRQVGRTRSSSRRHVGDTSRDDSRNRERQCVLNCRDVLSVAASCMQVHEYMPSAGHDGTAT